MTSRLSKEVTSRLRWGFGYVAVPWVPIGILTDTHREAMSRVDDREDIGDQKSLSQGQ